MEEKSSSRAFLPRRKQMFFALGNIGGLAVGQSSVLTLYAFYFMYLGVPLHPLVLSLILGIYAVWDGLNEPLVGYWSDNMRSRWGRRKPLIVAGLAPLIIFAFLIYTVPVDNPVSAGVYLLVTLMVYDLSMTLVISCWYALFPEISLDEKVRLNVSKYLQIFGLVGLVLGLGFPPLIAGSFPSPVEGYPVMGLILGVICAVFMLPTIFGIKEQPKYQIRVEEKISFRQSLKIALKNKSFLYYVLVQLLLQLAYSLVLSSLPMFFQGILGLGSLEYSFLLLATFITVLPFLFVWVKLASKRGAKHALYISMICFAIAFHFAFLINSPIIALIVLLAAGVGLGGLMLFPTILLSDVVDEDQLQTGQRREGLYAGVSGVIVKMSSALSWGVIGLVLTLFQINRDQLSPATLTPLTDLGLRLLVGLLPVVFVLLGILFLRRYPLAGERLEEVKRKVNEMNKKLLNNE